MAQGNDCYCSSCKLFRPIEGGKRINRYRWICSACSKGRAENMKAAAKLNKTLLKT